MFENIFNVKNIEKSANYSLFAGVFFTIISFITSNIIFSKIPSFIGAATIMFIVIMSLPILVKITESIKLEDKKSLFSKTKILFDFYIYFFIGCFIVLFLLSLAFPSRVLSADQIYGTSSNTIMPQKLGIPPPPVENSTLILSIFQNNFYVMLIAFVLSLIYGSGSLFLLTMHAAIFASALSNVLWQTMQNQGYLYLFTLISCNMGILFFHMIPEMAAYFIAAIAGCLLYAASLKEKIFSDRFYKILKMSLVVFISAVIVLAVSALIEVLISKPLIVSGMCLKNSIAVLTAAALLLIAVIVMEYKRKKL